MWFPPARTGGAVRPRSLLAAAFLFAVGCSVEPREKTIRTLEAKPEWLFLGDVCPAHAMPAKAVKSRWDRACEGGLLANCVRKCKADDEGACFGAAHSMATTGESAEVRDALYLQACRLGSAGGCTNAAAGRVARSPDKSFDECAHASFERTCDANDAWGCRMLATALVYGLEEKRDLVRARAAAGKACELWPDGDVCVSARKFLRELDEEQTPGE